MTPFQLAQHISHEPYTMKTQNETDAFTQAADLARAEQKRLAPQVQATPVPWHITGTGDGGAPYFEIRDSIDDVLFRTNPNCPQSVARANAELIVRAVNSHAALVAALADLLRAIEKSGVGYSVIPVATRLDAREAVALAKGGA